MASPNIAWSAPTHDRIPPTMTGLIDRCPDLIDIIVKHAIEPDAMYQVRPVYHGPEFLSRYHRPHHLPPPPFNVPIQRGRVIKCYGSKELVTVDRAPNFQLGDNPYRTFMEHNAWKANAAADTVDEQHLSQATNPPQHSDFLSLRLTCKTFYLSAWHVFFTEALVTVQVAGFGAPDLRQLLPHPTVRHPRTDDLEARLHTLYLIPTFSNHIDWSGWIQTLPRLRWVIPASIHLYWPDPQTYWPLGVSATYLWCGLKAREKAATKYILSLVGHLVKPRMFTRADQQVSIIRQISICAGCDLFEPVLNLVVGYDLHPPHRTNKPYLIHAAIQPSTPRPGQSPAGNLYHLHDLRDFSRRHLQQRRDHPRNPRSHTDVQLNYQMPRTEPTADEYSARWRAYEHAQVMMNLPQAGFAHWAHKCLGGLPDAEYVFHHG